MSSPQRKHVVSGGNLPGRMRVALPWGSPRWLAAAGRAVSSSSPSTVCLVLRMRLWLQRESCIRCFGGGARCCTDGLFFRWPHVPAWAYWASCGTATPFSISHSRVLRWRSHKGPRCRSCWWVSHAPAALSHSPGSSIGIPCRSGASVLSGTSGGTMREPSSVPSEALQCQVSGAVHSPQYHGYRHPWSGTGTRMTSDAVYYANWLSIVYGLKDRLLKKLFVFRQKSKI